MAEVVILADEGLEVTQAVGIACPARLAALDTLRTAE
ncbi:MAG: hypothetical protein JWM19_2366 [Actinomycetia bacterium]|nr:hypothetical protein [Actinomycetes bacterium]